MMLLLHHNRRAHGVRHIVTSFLSHFKAACVSAFFWPHMTWRRRLLRYALLGVMLFTLFGGDRGLFRLAIVLHDRAALQTDVQELIEKRMRLETELRSYTTDPATVEKLVREQLDMVKPGETVYKFPPR